MGDSGAEMFYVEVRPLLQKFFRKFTKILHTRHARHLTPTHHAWRPRTRNLMSQQKCSTLRPDLLDKNLTENPQKFYRRPRPSTTPHGPADIECTKISPTRGLCVTSTPLRWGPPRNMGVTNQSRSQIEISQYREFAPSIPGIKPEVDPIYRDLNRFKEIVGSIKCQHHKIRMSTPVKTGSKRQKPVQKITVN